jgi:hypothetical protein
VKPKRYLGDGVYVERSKTARLVITTEDGVRATNTIVFEPVVLDAFLDYVKVSESAR